MPEGDVVWLAARRLHEALAGRRLARSDFRVPRLATADLRGRTVLSALSLGRHVLVCVEDGLTIPTHLLMEGRWQIRQAGTILHDPGSADISPPAIGGVEENTGCTGGPDSP